jgi:carbamoyltransferase
MATILGISAYYHDSAAALVRDGRIEAAAQEERFSRKKHDPSFPQQAIAYCLEASGVSPRQIDYVAFYDKPFIKFERLLETYVSFAPAGMRSFQMALPVWIKEKLFQKHLIAQELQRLDDGVNWQTRMLFAEHHQSHAASAFFPSPFERAAILTMDGVGEWATTSAGIGDGNSFRLTKEIHFPHSIGLLYSAFTYYTGFKVNSGEYKLMGLAPYGEPRYTGVIFDNLIDLKDDGSFRLNMEYFDYCVGLRMTNRKFDFLFGTPARRPDQLIEQRHMDLAASVQAVTEEIVLRITRHLAKDSRMPNLCLAGGVALNCVANGKILRDGKFERIWVQPASGDAGGAIGAALAAFHDHCGQPRAINPEARDGMSGAYLGPSFSNDETTDRLAACGARSRVLSDNEIIQETANALADGAAVGWFQGRMEFGPRALGNRSILADARSPKMQSVLNLKVKYRESFRPFAPSVLSEEADKWFGLSSESPYMLIVADVVAARRIEMSDEQKQLFGIDKLNVPRSEIPAVTHVDNSARIQTVHADTNPKFHALLRKFQGLTGCPVLVNTSFNVRGEPLVCSPEDAFRCFMGTELDILVVGNHFLRKAEQDHSLRLDYQNSFEPD